MKTVMNYMIELCTDSEMFEWETVALTRDEALALDVGRMVAGSNPDKIVEVSAMKGDGTWDTRHTFFVAADSNVKNDNIHPIRY